MSITAGTLPIILAKASDIWKDNMSVTDLKPQIGVLQAIADNQTAQLQTVNLPDGVDVKIVWNTACDLTVEDLVTTDCTFSGTEADVASQTLSIDQAKQTKFSVPLDAFRENKFTAADMVALQLKRTMVLQAQTAASYCVGVIEANLGQSTYTNGGAWTVSGTSNTIPAAEWESTAIMGKFQISAIKNRFDMPFMISGENLYQLAFMARTSAGDMDKKGDFVRINDMPIYNDVVNIDEYNTSGSDTTYKSYLLNKGALAFASKGYYPTTPEVLDGNFTRFSIKNTFYPGLIHDVEMRVDCSSGVWSQHWKVIPRYKLFVNPVGCTATRTGILAFTRGPLGI